MHPFYAVHFPNLILEHWQLFHSWATRSWKSVPFSWFKILCFLKKKKKKGMLSKIIAFHNQNLLH